MKFIKMFVLLLYFGVVLTNSALSAQEEYSPSMGVWNLSALAKNANGSIMQTWNVGQNAAFYQTIFNTDGSITFKNKNNSNIILTSSPQYFLNYCQGTNCFEITNGNIDPSVVTNGNLTYITAIDDTNTYAKVTHHYELDAASPYIKYTATLRYKQNVTVTGERFVFNVPDKDAQVMTRDLKIIPFDNLKTYWSDLYTPKVIKFNSGLYFVASDTMESMKLQTSGTGSLVSFYSDYKENHPHFHYIRNGAGQLTYKSESKRSINDTYSASITFAINPSASPKTIIKTRQPYGYDSALTLTNHADLETPARIKAIAYGTEDETAPDYGTKGIVGRGIGWTKSVFVSGCSPPVNTDDCYQGSDLQDTEYKSLTDKLYLEGVEIVGHSITPDTDSRSTVSEGLQTLSQYDTRNWIDHGAGDGTINWEDFASQGAIKGDQNYDLDIFDQYNYKYAWSYVDLPTTTSYSPNMLQPANTGEVRPFFFYNNQVDNNVYDSKKIYLWSTINTIRKPELFYTNSNIDGLISERGVHIGHEYMAYDLLNYHAWYLNGGKIKITPILDAELAYIAGKKENGLLWSPTMSTLGDYLVSLKDISVIYNSDGTYNITNFGSSSITGITLLAEDTIRSATIDEQSLVSFGGSYGNNEIILPALAPNQSINLKITYGAKDTSIPIIISNDAGKIKVNEITGVWDNNTKQLTMTAEGTNVNRSFTVRIPAFANKAVTVRDTTSGTTIGSYTASGSGEITFSATLGSLHTFRIGEFEESAGGPAIISFAPISPTVNDYTGATRSFNFTVNQTLNVTWYLNNVVIKNSENGVTQASYSNTSASIGTWNVTALVQNANGTAMQEWVWIVTPGDETIPQTTYIVSLKTGWNLISAPLNLTTWILGNESAVGNPLNVTPTNCLSSIYRYNATSNLFEKSDHFANWGWWPATGSESFTKLEPGRGYWVMAQQDCTLNFTGKAPSDLEIPLNTGWNLIGWYSMNVAQLGEETVVGNPLNITPSNSLTSIYRYNTTSALFEKSDHFPDWGWWPATGSEDFTTLEPGRGYWLNTKNVALWKNKS